MGNLRNNDLGYYHDEYPKYNFAPVIINVNESTGAIFVCEHISVVRAQMMWSIPLLRWQDFQFCSGTNE